MIAPERLLPIQASWQTAMESYRVAPNDAEGVFNLLVATYSAPERHYHNLEHLAEMFEVVNRLAGQIEQPAALILAVWFHDAAYDTRAIDNENRSAELAVDLLGQIGVPASAIERIVQLIWATKHSNDPSTHEGRDTKALLDADLAILGAPEDRYQRYAADIRKEYAWLPDSEYRPARKTILERFLALPRIYSTQIMFDEREQQARTNLRDELKRMATSP